MGKLTKLLDKFNVKDIIADVRRVVNGHSGVVAGVGVVGVVAGTVLACKATLKMEQKSADHADIVKKAKTEEQQTGNKAVVGEAYGMVARDYVKTYAPSVLVLGVGIGLLLKSRGIEVAKNKELTAAYIALDAAFKKYRAQVAEKIGVEAEAKLMAETQQKNQHLMTCDSRFTGVDGSIFYFNESSQEFDKGQPRSNALVLCAIQANMNDKLNRKRIVYLNDLMRQCGHKELINGWEWCWCKTKPGTNQISFGLDDMSINEGFINGIDDVAKLRLTGLTHISTAFREGIFCEDGTSGEIGCGPCVIL